MASIRSFRSAFESLLHPNSSRTASLYVCRPCLLQQRQQQRNLHRSVKGLPVPPPTPFVPDVSTFLTLIGRGLSTHASKFESWEKLFSLTSPELKELGIDPPRTRKYLLRWIQKFRKGDFGIGGDFKYVENGIGELRVVEVPALSQIETKTRKTPSQKGTVSASQSPGMTKLILNVPYGSKTYRLESDQTTADLKKPKDFTLRNGHVIAGPHAQPIRGTNGMGATLKVVEGLWEDKRGEKVHGGERRRAETLHKLAVAEHRKNS